MSKIVFVGDIHGSMEMPRLLQIVKENASADIILQVGDLGIGFVELPAELRQPNFRFIRGNHDSPELSRRESAYAGDFGYIREISLFFISGASSVDRRLRTVGVDWWDDEELSMGQLNEAIEFFRVLQPRIMVSHDCPFSVYPLIGAGKAERSKTNMALAAMLEAHQPEMWFFGHHHKSAEVEFGGTKFTCLGIAEARGVQA